MLRLGAIFFATVLGLAAPAGAAELTGFGPIKFGMTKQEAWAAIDGKGKWETVNVLVYDYPIETDALPLDFLADKLQVQNGFREGRAAQVGVYVEWVYLSHGSCIGVVHYFVAAIKSKYNKTPIVNDNQAIDHKNKEEYIFTFEFGKEALIQVNAAIDSTKGTCDMYIWYNPPVPNPLPF